MHPPIPIPMISFIPAPFVQSFISSSPLPPRWHLFQSLPSGLHFFHLTTPFPPGLHFRQHPSSRIIFTPAPFFLSRTYSSHLKLTSTSGFHLFQPPSTYFYSSVSFIPACSIPFSSRVWYILPPLQNFLPLFPGYFIPSFPCPSISGIPLIPITKKSWLKSWLYTEVLSPWAFCVELTRDKIMSRFLCIVHITVFEIGEAGPYRDKIMSRFSFYKKWIKKFK